MSNNYIIRVHYNYYIWSTYPKKRGGDWRIWEDVLSSIDNLLMEKEIQDTNSDLGSHEAVLLLNRLEMVVFQLGKFALLPFHYFCVKPFMNPYWKKIFTFECLYTHKLSRDARISKKTMRLFDFICCQAIFTCQLEVHPRNLFGCRVILVSVICYLRPFPFWSI